MNQDNYLKGLNTLRFLAALLVVIGHCRQNLVHYKIYWLNHVPIFRKGSFAVEFFFVLSGFLLTTIAIREYNRYGKINYRSFFIRRALRILPLYYLSLVLGVISLYILYPEVFNKNYLSFPIREGIVYYIFLLPNYVVVNWSGNVGALFSLWSIGVEEQFYLFFPFMMGLYLKKQKYLYLFLFITLSAYLLFYLYCFFWLKAHPGVVMVRFILTLKFHFMFIGCFFAALVQNKQLSPFINQLISNRFFQLLIWALFIYILNFSISFDKYHLLHAFVFALLIIVVSNEPYTVINIELKPFVYLGTISYGIYIFHPYVSYIIRFLMLQKIPFLNTISNAPWLYYVLEVTLTIITAHFSYQFFEKRFLRLKEKFIT